MSTSSTAPYADLWTIVHKTVYFSCMYLAYKCPELALTSHVVKSVHCKSHTAFLTSVREPPQFVCLYYTDLCASAMICPMHVFVCSRATCYIHTTRMTFGPLSIAPTWGHHQCPLDRLTILEFLLISFLTPKRMKILSSIVASLLAR